MAIDHHFILSCLHDINPFLSRISIILLGSLTFFTVLYWTKTHGGGRPNPPYPPGPSPHWLTGNILDFPKNKPWLSFMEMGEVYGDIIHFEVLGNHYIILNSLNDANELLAKRSSIYSDRTKHYMLEIIGVHITTGILPYKSQMWRKHRTFFQEHLIKTLKLRALRPIHEKKVNDMLKMHHMAPDDFMLHHRTFAAAIVMSVMYGHDVSPTDDEYVSIAEHTMRTTGLCLVNQASMIIDALPLLRYLPAWFPGMAIKRTALEGRKYFMQMMEHPINTVMKKMREGEAPKSIVATLLQDIGSSVPDQYHTIASYAATAYSAGADTTAVTLTIFFQLMSLHPIFQIKAQEQIDSVVGYARLPTFEDRNTLPFVEAIFKETMRFVPILPLGLPHASMEDDVYKGYYIPKGAIVMANLWSINRNPNHYHDPDVFNPERFLNENGCLINDAIYPFGFGKRACAGRYLASETIWLAMVRTLSVYNIRPKRNQLGQEIPIDFGYTAGLIVHPLPFECNITPRSEDALRLITGDADVAG